MQVKDNPAVIRIPVANPSCKKEGLLEFALPREVLTGETEPQFYATQDSVTIGVTADAPVETPAPQPPMSLTMTNDPQSLVDLVLQDVHDAHKNIQMMASDMSYAGFTLRRTGSDFARMDSPLSVAAADNGDRDVNEAGTQIDFILWSARNGLHDCQHGLGNSSGDANSASCFLTDATDKLDAYRKTLQAGNSLIAVVDDAQSAIHVALDHTSKITTTLVAKTTALRDGDGSLMFADQYVSDIRNDQDGRDVSVSARRLRTSIDDVKARLGGAEQTLKDVGGQVPTAESEIEHAEHALDALRQALTTNSTRSS